MNIKVKHSEGILSSWRKQPIIIEIPAIILVNRLSERLRKSITLVTIPDSEISHWSELGYDAIWLMGVWKRSKAGRLIAQRSVDLMRAYEQALSKYNEEDVTGSPYSIYDYTVDERIGTDAELLDFRDRLHAHNLRLILDFVPNHVGIDHPWLLNHPEYFVTGNEDVFQSRPGQFFERTVGSSTVFFAYGKEGPYMSWTDTAQLDYRKPEVHMEMKNILIKVAKYCDGLRCDMAMLVLKDVFINTWGILARMADEEFWPSAILQVRQEHPDFLMIAEAYWDKESQLQKCGFDAVYDGVLYKRLINADTHEIRLHLNGSFKFQKGLVRYTENHDEQRSLSSFGKEQNAAASMLALLLPGTRLLHDGQMEGFRRYLPVHLGRRFEESPDANVYDFFVKLLRILQDPIFHEGEWCNLKLMAASPENYSHRNIIAYLWQKEGKYRLVVVNYSRHQSQAYILLPEIKLKRRNWIFIDLMGAVRGLRDGDGLANRGIYVDMSPFGYHIFELKSGLVEKIKKIKHKNGIYSTSWSPDGRYLASGSLGGEIILWDRIEDRIWNLAKYNSSINCLAWSPDSQILVTGSDDKTLSIWNVKNKKIEKGLTGHFNNVITACWSRNGLELASGSVDRQIYLWRPKENDTPILLSRHNDSVNSLCYSPKKEWILASGSGDHTIRLWDTRTKKILDTFQFKDWISCIVWSPDAELIAAATGGGNVVVYNVKRKRIEVILEGHMERVLAVSYSSNGRFLVSKSADGTVLLWDCERWVQILSIIEAGEFLGGLTFHPELPVISTRDDNENVITVWKFDFEGLLSL